MERKIPLNHYELVYLIEYVKNSWLVKGGLATLSTVLVHLFGAWDIALLSLVTLIALDLIAKLVRMSYDYGGFTKAIKGGHIRSRVMREKSMYKFLRYALTLAAGNQIAKVVEYGTAGIVVTISGIPISFAIRSFFILYICISEIISIIETLIGVNGDDLEALKDVITGQKRSLFDRLIDLIINKIDERLFTHNKEE